MCTVSFVCSNGKAIITSNRDEQAIRPSLAPAKYNINSKNIIFPKDPRAGGTWFAFDEKGNVLVLLNGASEKHQWNPPYRKSRGLIVLDLISAGSAIRFWETIDLDNIEPFTLVLFEQQQLYQFRWNGKAKETTPLDVTRNYVWSSSTLYPQEVREKRAQWFTAFLETKPNVTEAEMFNFHRYTEDENKENGLVINRNDELLTLSITQVVISPDKVALVHHDLVGKTEFLDTFPLF